MKPIYGRIKKEEKPQGIPLAVRFAEMVVYLMLGLILITWGFR